MPRLDVALCLYHGLMRRASRTETVTGIRERRVPLPLQHLQYRLLDESIKRTWDAELAHATSIRLGYLDPPHRLRFVRAVQQRGPYRQPVLTQEPRWRVDRHAVHTRCPLVSFHTLQRLLQVLPFTYFFHQSVVSRRAFSLRVRRHRFSPSICGPRGFTPTSALKAAMRFLLRFHVEFSGSLAAPFRSGLQASPP